MAQARRYPPRDPYHGIKALYPFPNQIIIKDIDSAKHYAQQTLDKSKDPRQLVLWVDASLGQELQSKQGKFSAAAVSYGESFSEEWNDFISFNTIKRGSSNDAEFLAIQDAFHTAYQLIDRFV